MSWKIPLFKIYWDNYDVNNVTREIQSGMNWAVGPQVTEFEELIKEKIGAKYAVTFNSGTSALHSLLLAHNINKGDEVIVPSFTFIATANSPLFVGAKPVFADIERETLGLDPESVNEMITDKTKAILPIHYGGCPCKIRELKEIAEDHDLILIEDAAEAQGAKIGHKKVGTFGDSAVLSFCQNKIMTTGEGGAVVTDSEEVFEKLNLIRSHGRLEHSNYFTSLEPFDYVDLGFNFRMSNLTASLGIAQISKVDTMISMRRNNSLYLNEHLKDINGIKPIIPPESYYHVYQLYTIIANNRDELMKHLADKGIMSKIYFDPVHLTHFYKNTMKYECELPVTEELSKKVVTLPMYPALKEKDMDFIVQEIKEFYG
ncbi:DegT/DnrJ/EryC1/StrS family aminotransferase [Methanobacterium sp.]|uniref:DegT/DnrJ/EryC1/StrS family aminotransferase n=1 Tax=Methanobacterium sp. TaxID=2164 RepID=UPI003C719CDC